MAAPDAANKARMDAEAAKEAARQKRMDELKAERERKAEETARNRAASNPLFDPTNRPEAPQLDDGFVRYYSWIGGGTTGSWKLYKEPVDSPKAASAEARSQGGATAAQFGSSSGANTLATKATTTSPTTVITSPNTVVTSPNTVITSPNTVITSPNTVVTTANTTVPTGPSLARDTFKRTLAIFLGDAEAAKSWTDELYNLVSKAYRDGFSIDQSFNVALLEGRNNPNLKAFTDRFKGIYALQDLKQQGKLLEVPTIAEYISSQNAIANIFNEAGLGDLATEAYTGDLLGKGNSVSTIAEKISQTFNRIDRAPAAIKDTLSRYYPTVDRTTLAKTLLLGEKGVQQLVDELAQYEVLASAEQQGLGAINRVGGLTAERAREYARRGETFESLTPQFSKIARALPTVSKLSGISRTEDMGQIGLEQALITDSAKQLAELERLSMEEEARFSGKAGRAELGLASQRRGNRAF